MIQGTPFGTYKALIDPVAQGETHPMYKAFEMLGYDAETLGNHEFNLWPRIFWIAWLRPLRLTLSMLMCAMLRQVTTITIPIRLLIRPLPILMANR